MKHILLYIFTFVICINNIIANSTDIGKLIPNLDKYPDSIKVNLLIDKGKNFFKTAPDTSIILIKKALEIAEKNNYQNRIPEILRLMGNSFYYMSNFNEALKYYNKSLEYSKQINDDLAQANALKNIGIIYLMQGDFKNAVANLKNALTKFNKADDKKGLANTYQVLSAINYNIGNYSKALTYAQKSLKLYKVLNDTSRMAQMYGNIGNIHADLGNSLQALRYYNNALVILKKAGDKLGTARTYSNIGSIYNDMHQYHKAIKEFDEAIKLYSELKNTSGLSEAYTDIGKSYKQLGQYDKAIQYLSEALELRKELDDKNGIIRTYNILAEMYASKHLYKDAIDNAQKALEIAKEIGALPAEKATYETLYKIYENLKDYEKAFKYHVLFTELKDSIFNIEKVKALNELETKYQVEKKEQELEKQRILLSKQEIVRKALTGVIILMMLLALVIYLNLRQKKRSNQLLSEQKAKIEAIHKELKSSITYAQRIQKASLASKTYLKQFISEYFIIFEPKDIVSGDFYWWQKINNKIIIAIADCTGHGVPGALMSMLGIGLLKEAVINEGITKPKDILDFMRIGILDIFKQQEKYGTHDGMDMAIIALDIENCVLEFSGANNPIYIVRPQDKPDVKLADEGNKNENRIIKNIFGATNLFELKPDRMPIGKYQIMKPFTQVNIRVLDKDMIYLMSDGYQDQFGGEKNKKFTKKKLKILLTEIYNLNTQQQKSILLETLKKWKNGYPQTDDITLMGIRITKSPENQKC
jgi:tetratricopeptide (TPR) repeat protein